MKFSRNNVIFSCSNVKNYHVITWNFHDVSHVIMWYWALFFFLVWQQYASVLMSVFRKKHIFFTSLNLRLSEMCREIAVGCQRRRKTWHRPVTYFGLPAPAKGWLQVCQTCCCRLWPADQESSASIVFLDARIELCQKHFALGRETQTIVWASGK